MKKQFLALLLGNLMLFSYVNAQSYSSGRNIFIKMTPLKNTKVYLGSYYGTTLALFDSAFLNEKSEGFFKASNKLTGGIYFVVTKEPDYAIQFDFLMDKDQQFRIVADTAKKDKPIISGSFENDLREPYKSLLLSEQKRMQAYSYFFKDKKNRTKKDTTDYIKEDSISKRKITDYQDSIIKHYPESTLSLIFNILKRPTVPAIPVVKGKADSLYPYHFVKNHYWDDIAFSDDRMLHTQFFEPKLDEYFKYYISIEADSIIKEVNYILLSARTSKEIYPYLLNKFTKEYMNPKFMGQDKVFVFLFENFYLAKGDTSFLDASNKKIVTERAYNLIANQIGVQASEMNFPDSSGKVVPLYSMQNSFIIVAFWDPTCGHCKIEIPRLDSMYRAKWKALDVGIYAVNINEPEFASWKKFISENKLTGWIHTHESNAVRIASEKAKQMNFRQAYDIYKTPTFYLLDKDKRIIAKQLSMEQFDEIIKLKKQSK